MTFTAPLHLCHGLTEFTVFTVTLSLHPGNKRLYWSAQGTQTLFTLVSKTAGYIYTPRLPTYQSVQINAINYPCCIVGYYSLRRPSY